MKKKILLITHQTSKTGAPFTILLIFKELLKKINIELDVFALSAEGELHHDFKHLSRYFFNTEKYYGYKKTFYEKILSFFKLRSFETPTEIVIQEIELKSYDLIYANTIETIPIAVRLKKSLNCKLIAHIHELDHSILECLPDFENYTDEIDFHLVPSIANKELLIKKYKINTSNIDICRAAALPPPQNFSLSLKENTFNVYMCGTANWRKGEDLFLLLANEVIKEDNTIHFYWIGNQSNIIKNRTNIEIEKINTKNNIHFVGETKNIYEFISKMDCFVLTSREDPFPLAAIEAGMAGLPIICFNKGNGIKEVLNDKECIIEYLNINQMKSKILELKHNKLKTKRIGENNLHTFKKYTPEKVSLDIMRIINEVLV